MISPWKNRDLVQKGMTPDQVAEGQRRAAAFVAQKSAGGAEASPPNAAAGSTAPDTAAPPKATGTAFFITPDGYLLTAAHVLAEAQAVKVRTPQGVKTAKVVRTDGANDVAILKVEGAYRPLAVVPSRTVRLADAVFTIGFPNPGIQGSAPKFTKGEVSSLSGAQDDPRYLQVSVPLQPGNSGGPLVDRAGNVVGLVAARLGDDTALLTGALPQNVNYAVKNSYLIPRLESIPDLAGKLPEPGPGGERPFDDVVREVEAAACLILVY